MDKKTKTDHGMKCEDGKCMCMPAMGTMCMSVTGVLVLVSGISMLLGGLNTLSPMLSWMVSGATLTLAGLSLLVHGMKMCPMCKC